MSLKDRVMAKWRQRKASPVTVSTNALRPQRWQKKGSRYQPVEHEVEMMGTFCMRCGDETTEITCLYQDYWLCPECVYVHKRVALWAEIHYGS